MPTTDNVPTWIDPWMEQNFNLLSAPMQQSILAERGRWRVEAEAAQRAREASLNRFVASIDLITSTTISDQPFYTLHKAIEITARAITVALHGIPADEVETSEYWFDTLAKHQERLRALIELGRLAVFDVRTAAACMFESGLPDWTQCAYLGLTRSGMVSFARCQGVEIGDDQKPEKTSKKKQDTMLRVVAALIYLRNQPRSSVAISKEISNWTERRGINVTAKTVNNYITDIGNDLGVSRTELGLTERDDASD